jgi:photosystem II stability/assembly factor-like uncharacterized protein
MACLTNQNLYSIAASPNGTVFATTQCGGGIFRSTNEGKTWKAVAPAYSNYKTKCIVVARNEFVYAPVSGVGVIRSTDNGDTWQTIWKTGWQAAWQIPDDLEYFTLSPGRDSELYACTERGLFRSTTNGATWVPCGLNIDTVIAVTVTKQGMLFASMFGLLTDPRSRTSTPYGRVYRSSDDGATWSQVATAEVNQMTSDSSGAVFIAALLGIFRTTDDGRTWVSINQGLVGSAVSAVSMTENNRILIGTGRGVFISEDQGNIWTSINSPIEEYVVAIGFATTPRGKIFAATSSAGLYRSILPPASVERPKPHQGSALCQNYPNPFTQSTSITFTLPHPAFATLTLYDATGRQVRTLAHQLFSAGEQEVRFERERLPAGTYFYWLKSAEVSEERALVIGQ